MAVKRGQCPVCRFRVRLRKDGTLQSHHMYCGNEPQPDCAGSGGPPRPFDWRECGDCLGYASAQPMLAEAFASVGIEYGRSTAQMARDFFAAFHGRGHQEAA